MKIIDNYNNMNIKHTLSILTFFLVFAFSAKAQESKSDTAAFVQIIQNPKIEILNNYYKEVRSTDTMMNGYKIQIYFGSREKAYEKTVSFNEIFPDTEATVIYESPNFKTLVGRYPTKLDADGDLKKIQGEFPGAFIVRSKIKRE